MLETAFPGVRWVDALVDVCSTLFFPVDGASIGFAVFLLSAMNALAHWYRPDGPLSPDAIARQYADLFLCGLERGQPQGAASATPGGSR